jgi:hypothetical protein
VIEGSGSDCCGLIEISVAECCDKKSIRFVMVELGLISKVFCIVNFFLLIEYNPYTIKKGGCKPPFFILLYVLHLYHFLKYLKI